MTFEEAQYGLSSEEKKEKAELVSAIQILAALIEKERKPEVKSKLQIGFNDLCKKLKAIS